MSKQRILVVDDELDNRVMMRYFIESWGYDVELAADGQEALDKISARQPDLVLLDLEMPILDGFDTCDRLKSDPATEQIPIIMFTGLDQTADKVRGIRKGADDYVVKTVDPEELQARIEMILRRSQRLETRESSSKQAESHAVSGSLAELEFPEAMQLILAYGKDGVMHLQDGERLARVYLKGGRIVNAVSDGIEGQDAFYKLAFWQAGKFHFQVGESETEQKIKASGTTLLIEATRRLDEWNLISKRIPSFDVVPHRVPLTDGDSLKLTSDDWKIIRLVDGRRTITGIAEEAGQDLFETGRLTFGLLTVGALSLEPVAENRDDFSDRVPELASELPGDAPLHLTALQWKVLANVDGRRPISALANRVGLPASAVAEMIEDMAGLGWVVVNSGESGDPPVEIRVEGDAVEGEVQGDSGSSNVEEFRPRIRAIGFE